MNPLWLILIIPIVSGLGFMFCAVLASGKMADERIERMQEIEEAREEIVQECIDHAGCLHPTNSYEDAEYSLGGEGEGNIQKILEGLL